MGSRKSVEHGCLWKLQYTTVQVFLPQIFGAGKWSAENIPISTPVSTDTTNSLPQHSAPKIERLSAFTW